MTKLLFVVNVDWFFISHRLPIALSAMEKGYEVHLACADTGQCDSLEGLGIRVHRIKMSRSGTQLLSEIKSLWSILKVSIYFNLMVVGVKWLGYLIKRGE